LKKLVLPNIHHNDALIFSGNSFQKVLSKFLIWFDIPPTKPAIIVVSSLLNHFILNFLIIDLISGSFNKFASFNIFLNSVNELAFLNAYDATIHFL